MAYIGLSLFAIGLFPEICWLAYSVGGAAIVIYLYADWFYKWDSFASLGDKWLNIFGGLLLWFFCIFMAIFGEVILIPWFLVSFIPLGSGYLLYSISSYI